MAAANNTEEGYKKPLLAMILASMGIVIIFINSIEQKESLFLVAFIILLSGFMISIYYLLRTNATSNAKMSDSLMMLALSIIVLMMMVFLSLKITILVFAIGIIASYSFLFHLGLAIIISFGNPKIELT
jgi:FtsH-binding integral membrane protein